MISLQKHPYFATPLITVDEGVDYDTSSDVKIVIEKNHVWSNQNNMISWNSTKSFVHPEIDEGTGIFLTRNQDTYLYGYMKIANNLSYLNGASGIVCHYTDRGIIINNTLYLNGSNNGVDNDALPGGIGINSSDDVLVQNNIVWARDTKWALGILAQPVTNLIVDSNIIFNTSGIEITRDIDTGWTEEDPLFVDPESYDFHLLEASPALNTGNGTDAPADDIDGNLRSDGAVDMGCYEH